jgi:hypothetical protein
MKYIRERGGGGELHSCSISTLNAKLAISIAIGIDSQWNEGVTMYTCVLYGDQGQTWLSVSFHQLEASKFKFEKAKWNANAHIYT